MATGWYGRSVAAASLTRLPRGICCGVCGLTEPTPDSTEDGPADTAAAWAAMTRHVLETHCTPCCVCGEAAGGLIELRTGTLAPWVRRSRAPSALHALRARRRTQQRDRDRLERAGITVVGAFASPTHDEYVQGKAHDKGTIALTGEFRLAVIDHMVASDPSVTASPWEVRKDEFVDFPYVVPELTAALYANPRTRGILCVYVCGPDLVQHPIAISEARIEVAQSVP